MTRNLYRRLERLEAQAVPTGEPRVCQVVYVDADGTKELGPRIELPQSRPCTAAGEEPIVLGGQCHRATDNVD